MYCKHGNYVGGMGIDWMCIWCENGEDPPPQKIFKFIYVPTMGERKGKPQIAITRKRDILDRKRVFDEAGLKSWLVQEEV